jgi:hypothetical protein
LWQSGGIAHHRSLDLDRKPQVRTSSRLLQPKPNDAALNLTCALQPRESDFQFRDPLLQVGDLATQIPDDCRTRRLGILLGPGIGKRKERPKQ